jgi:hypothetical protein
MVDKVKDIITRSRILLQGQDIITRSGYYYKVKDIITRSGYYYKVRILLQGQDIIIMGCGSSVLGFY